MPLFTQCSIRTLVDEFAWPNRNLQKEAERLELRFFPGHRNLRPWRTLEFINALAQWRLMDYHCQPPWRLLSRSSPIPALRSSLPLLSPRPVVFPPMLPQYRLRRRQACRLTPLVAEQLWCGLRMISVLTTTRVFWLLRPSTRLSSRFTSSIAGSCRVCLLTLFPSLIGALRNFWNMHFVECDFADENSVRRELRE